LSIDQLRETAGLRIGFVCTGNTCRSPMAEALARDIVAERLRIAPGRIGDFGFAIESMGVLAGEGAPAAEHAVTVMQRRGLDLSRHVSEPATLERVSALDHVFGLTQSHVEALRAMLPPRKSAIVDLLDPDGDDVPDPIGGSLEDYRRCADSIEKAIARRATTWI
jgi:protein-tyrosine phosphatase